MQGEMDEILNHDRPPSPTPSFASSSSSASSIYTDVFSDENYSSLRLNLVDNEEGDTITPASSYGSDPSSYFGSPVASGSRPRSPPHHLNSADVEAEAESGSGGGGGAQGQEEELEDTIEEAESEERNADESRSFHTTTDESTATLNLATLSDLPPLLPRTVPTPTIAISPDDARNPRLLTTSFRRSPPPSRSVSLTSLITRSRPPTPASSSARVAERPQARSLSSSIQSGSTGTEKRKRRFSLSLANFGTNGSRRRSSSGASSSLATPHSTAHPHPHPQPVPRTITVPVVPIKTFKTRPRSISAPLLSSPLSSLPSVAPFPLGFVEPKLALETVQPRDLINTMIPREILVRTLFILMEVCYEESGNEKDGNRLGQKNLARIGLVSKSWHLLSLDGQLWSTVTAPSTSNPKFLLKLFQESGTFVRSLDLRDSLLMGRDEEEDSGVEERQTRLHLLNRLIYLSEQGLQKVDLTGCSRAPNTSIKSLLLYSPSLTTLSLSSHRSLDPSSLTPLQDLTHLTNLNISRCKSLNADEIIPILPTSLVKLNIASLPLFTSPLFRTLVLSLPNLESLDASYNPHLTDAAFTLLPSNTDLNLRHLSLSANRLTDEVPRALTTLAPFLESLELARIGSPLASPGLVHLFERRRGVLKKLDLEDAISLDDRVLRALVVPRDSRGEESVLETLILSSAVGFSDAAIRGVVMGCKNLRWLEADGTGVTDATCRLFVRLVKERGSGVSGVPKMLSVLDNRGVGRRIYDTNTSNGGLGARTRMGHRGEWAQIFGYHTPTEGGESGITEFSEVDETRVVVRSFVGSLRLDQADEQRRRKAAELAAKKNKAKDAWRSGLLEMKRRREQDDETRASCVVS